MWIQHQALNGLFALNGLPCLSVVRPGAGATPTAAMATAVVPLAAPALMEEDLLQLMAGALRVLRPAGCALVGGHSSEGAELALGEPLCLRL